MSIEDDTPDTSGDYTNSATPSADTSGSDFWNNLWKAAGVITPLVTSNQAAKPVTAATTPPKPTNTIWYVVGGAAIVVVLIVIVLARRR